MRQRRQVKKSVKGYRRLYDAGEVEVGLLIKTVRRARGFPIDRSYS
jgi:hypothetical protein